MTARCLAAVILDLPRLEERPGSLLAHEARLREWFKDVRDYCRHPFLLRQAIEWRTEILEGGSAKGDHAQVREALRRLLPLARLLGVEAPRAA